MDLKQKFKQTLEMYPEKIDISDGKISIESGSEGFHSKNLISYYEAAEEKAGLAGEWESLFVWIIFQSLHEKAKTLFKNGIVKIERDVDEDMVSRFLRANLKQEGFQDMKREWEEFELKGGKLI
jgi:hypothetical protein